MLKEWDWDEDEMDSFSISWNESSWVEGEDNAMMHIWFETTF